MSDDDNNNMWGVTDVTVSFGLDLIARLTCAIIEMQRA